MDLILKAHEGWYAIKQKKQNKPNYIDIYIGKYIWEWLTCWTATL